MFDKISEMILQKFNSFPKDDFLIFKNHFIKINKNNFNSIFSLEQGKTITFIDGGQAEILSAVNFCLSFIRVFAQTFKNNKRVSQKKNEFFLLTTAKWINNGLFYDSKIFPLKEKLFNENLLLVSSQEISLKTGKERALISKVINMARRFAELELASKVQSDYILLDGTLDSIFPNENVFLNKLNDNVCSLAKTSYLFTKSGNSPLVLLNKSTNQSTWYYKVENKTFFVKLNENSKHIFRFDGNPDILPFLINNSKDTLFLGYPYGLIYADKHARITNLEKSSLYMKFMLKKENKLIREYLTSLNAHSILDNIS